MVYRDMTFCDYNKCKDFDGCHRALTQEVKDKANKWWGNMEGEAPISLWIEHPDCFEEVLHEKE